MDNEDQKLLATLGELNDAILAGTEHTGPSWLKVQAGSGAEAALNAMVQAAVEAEGAMVGSAAASITNQERSALSWKEAITDLIDLHGPGVVDALLAEGPQFFSAALVADPDPGCEIREDDAPCEDRPDADAITFRIDKNPGEPVIKINYDGRFFIHGREVAEDKALYNAFVSFFRQSGHYEASPAADLDQGGEIREVEMPAPSADRPLVREALAAHAHAVWARWMAWQGAHADLTPKAVRGSDGGMDYVKNVDAVRRWARQQGTPYADLSEAERASDRAIADEYLAILDGGAP